MLDLSKKFSYSNPAKSVPNIMNEKPPTSKHIIIKFKLSGIKRLYQQLLNKKKKKQTTRTKETAYYFSTATRKLGAGAARPSTQKTTASEDLYAQPNCQPIRDCNKHISDMHVTRNVSFRVPFFRKLPEERLHQNKGANKKKRIFKIQGTGSHTEQGSREIPGKAQGKNCAAGLDSVGTEGR